jgi:hypothetical protein
MRKSFKGNIETSEHIGEPLNRVGEIHALRGASRQSMVKPMNELISLYKHHFILTFTVVLEQDAKGWRVRSLPDVNNFY